MSEQSFTADVKPASEIPGWYLHRRLYDWVLRWADSAYSGWALFLLSFAESSFFPVPPDVLLAPLTLGNRRKWWRFALSCSLASVLGGLFGYAIGYWLWWSNGPDFSVLAQFFFQHIPGFTEEKFRLVQAKYDQYSFWVVFAAGFTPIPYKIITITAGAFDINFGMFLIASTVGRSARFFLVAGLFGKYGSSIKPFVDKYFNWLCLLFLLLLVGGFLVLKYIH